MVSRPGHARERSAHRCWCPLARGSIRGRRRCRRRRRRSCRPADSQRRPGRCPCADDIKSQSTTDIPRQRQRQHFRGCRTSLGGSVWLCWEGRGGEEDRTCEERCGGLRARSSVDSVVSYAGRRHSPNVWLSLPPNSLLCIDRSIDRSSIDRRGRLSHHQQLRTRKVNHAGRNAGGVASRRPARLGVDSGRAKNPVLFRPTNTCGPMSPRQGARARFPLK
jgi:hypothetical protein